MKDNKKLPENAGTENEAHKLTEEELVQAAGGDSSGNNCFFEPESPLRWDLYNGQYRVKCKFTGCNIGTWCKCHGTPRCIDRMHIIELYNIGIHVAAPKHEYNHFEQRKWIKNFDPQTSGGI